MRLQHGFDLMCLHCSWREKPQRTADCHDEERHQRQNICAKSGCPWSHIQMIVAACKF